MGYRWKPNASQKAAYSAKMRAIEEEKQAPVTDNYDYNCTGDCCTGDQISFFNAGKSGERLYGIILSESYGRHKQQHTFTIEVNGEKMLIKGRNLYKNGVLRKKWPNEADREKILDEKHQRGDAARSAAKERKEARDNDRLYHIPKWAMDEDEL